MSRDPPVHACTVPVLRRGVEAALDWLQFPQQDANNIEKKPKVHLETEVQEGGRQRSGVALVAWGGVPLGTRNPKPWRCRAVRGAGCTEHCSRLEDVAWRLGGPTSRLLRVGAQGPSFHPGPRVGGQAVSPCIQHLLWHKALAFT